MPPPFGSSYSITHPTHSRPKQLIFDPIGNRTGDVWHAWVEGIHSGQLYAYRVDGPYQPTERHRFNFSKLLLDPCASAISPLSNWDQSFARGYDASAPQRDLLRSDLDDAGESCRGMDNAIFYTLKPEKRYYENYTGTGNTINANHAVVREHIVAALRYWRIEMHVDGFRFDLASALGRDDAGQLLANAPLLEQIAEDPILRDVKIIAEAWDAAGTYEVGGLGRVAECLIGQTQQSNNSRV